VPAHLENEKEERTVTETGRGNMNWNVALDWGGFCGNKLFLNPVCSAEGAARNGFCCDQSGRLPLMPTLYFMYFCSKCHVHTLLSPHAKLQTSYQYTAIFLVCRLGAVPVCYSCCVLYSSNNCTFFTFILICFNVLLLGTQLIFLFLQLQMPECIRYPF